MITHDCFRAAFETAFRAGRATQTGTDKPAAFSDARLRAVRSALATTADHLAIRFHEGAPTSSLDLEPYLRRYDHWARQSHERATPRQLPSSIDTAVSNVRFAVWVVRGWHLGRAAKRGPDRPRDSLPQWMRSLYDAARSSGVHHGFGGALGALADVLLAHDVTSLAALPDDHTVCRWLEQAGHVGHGRTFILLVYRAAARVLDPSLPQWFTTNNPGERGLRSLSQMRALLAAEPDLDPRTAGSEAMIRVIAPYAHGDMLTYIAHAKGVRSGWANGQWLSLDRVLASALRLGVEVSGMDLLDLYLATCKASLITAAPTEGVRRKQRGTAVEGEEPTVPVMRAVVDECALLSSRASYLRSHDAVQPSWYTSIVRTDEANVYRACRAAHGQLSAQEPTTWDRFQFGRQGIELAMKQQPTTVGHINRDLLLDAVTCPQAVALGIPYLTAEALELRERVLARSGDTRLALQYEALVMEFVAFVTMLWIGLRPKNFAGALHGKHLTPIYQLGKPTTIRSAFRGIEDEEVVRLKKSKHEVDKSENLHEDEVPVGLLHPLLLADFLSQRVRRLVACRALPSAEAYCQTTDRFAFFVSDESVDLSPGGYCPHPAGTVTGRYYGSAPLSAMFGHALYRVATEVLGRQTLPEWGDPAMVAQYRGLFRGHKGVRFLLGSYWGGIRGEWGYAQWRTNDTLATLTAHYSKITPEQRRAMNRTHTGIEHPHQFDALMDHLRAGGAVDWARFNPDQPERVDFARNRKRKAS